MLRKCILQNHSFIYVCLKLHLKLKLVKFFELTVNFGGKAKKVLIEQTRRHSAISFVALTFRTIYKFCE